MSHHSAILLAIIGSLCTLVVLSAIANVQLSKRIARLKAEVEILRIAIGVPTWVPVKGAAEPAILVPVDTHEGEP